MLVPRRPGRVTEFDNGAVAFVLGLCDTGLGAVRSLGQVGIRVIGLDPNRATAGFKSRYCDAKLCPDPIREQDELLDFLLSQGRALDQPGILFPADDAFVLFVSRHRDDLGRFFCFAMPSVDTMESIMNKRRQCELAEHVGTPYPKTFYPETLEDVEQIKNEIDYPAFIKGRYSYLWQWHFSGMHKGFQVDTPEELVDRFNQILPLGEPVIVQSVILGPDKNIFKVIVYINQEGQSLAAFSLEKTRQQPVMYGVASLAESKYAPELIELGLAFAQGIGYRGIGEIEFKKDERDGCWKMTELNPRVWLQVYLGTRCGVNFPLIQYLDLTGQEPKAQTGFAEGVKWWDPLPDLKSFLYMRRRGELSFRRWVKSIVGVRVSANFTWDDPLPFLHANRYGLLFLRTVFVGLPKYLLRNRRTT